MSRLEVFISETFGHEGGFQNHPKDKGNYYQGRLYGTIWGITARDHFNTFKKCLDLYRAGNVMLSRDTAVNFYRRAHYWNPLYDLIADASLAFRIWDFGINAGVYRSVVKIQKTIKKYYFKGLKVDGVFGEYTLRTINRLSIPEIRSYPKVKLVEGESELYTLYVTKLEKFYRSLRNFVDFGRGWLRRLHTVFNGVPDLYQPLPEPITKLDIIKR